MPIYYVTIEPNGAILAEYRIKADSLEAAKDFATDRFWEHDIDDAGFGVYGHESSDQDTPADFAAGE